MLGYDGFVNFRMWRAAARDDEFVTAMGDDVWPDEFEDEEAEAIHCQRQQS